MKEKIVDKETLINAISEDICDKINPFIKRMKGIYDNAIEHVIIPKIEIEIEERGMIIEDREMYVSLAKYLAVTKVDSIIKEMDDHLSEVIGQYTGTFIEQFEINHKAKGTAVDYYDLYVILNNQIDTYIDNMGIIAMVDLREDKEKIYEDIQNSIGPFFGKVTVYQ